LDGIAVALKLIAHRRKLIAGVLKLIAHRRKLIAGILKLIAHRRKLIADLGRRFKVIIIKGNADLGR